MRQNPDTAHVRIYLSGPLSVDDRDNLDFFSITSHSNSGSISFTKKGYEKGLQLNLYTASGQQIQTNQITENQTKIQVLATEGIYLYEIIDLETREKAGTGKLQF